MTQWTRTIARQVTNSPWPAWRTAMTEADKVYTIGDSTSTLGAKLVVPGGTLPPGFLDETLLRTLAGHNGAANAHDLGAHGSMLFAIAGEGTWANILQRFDLATGVWTYDQQPHWLTSQAAAQAANSDWYYNPSQAASILAGRPNAALNSSWDGLFPATTVTGGTGWIYWRAPITFSHGNNECHAFRYNMPEWLPASMTGLGVGVMVINQNNHAGYPGVNGPEEVYPGFWGDLWPSTTRRKWWVHYKNLHTGVWGRLPSPEPDRGSGPVDIHRTMAAVDTAGKRLYYVMLQGSDVKFYYYDFTSGIAGATVSAMTTAVSQFGDGWSIDDGTSFVMTDGHPTGRRLCYFFNGAVADSLMMVDLDTAKTWKLAVSMGITGWTGGTQTGMTYRASTNELIITVYIGTSGGASNVRKVVIPVPSDPTNAANYTATITAIPFASGHAGSDTNGWKLYGRAKLHPTLGVIMWRQENGPMLAYRPS